MRRVLKIEAAILFFLSALFYCCCKNFSDETSVDYLASEPYRALVTATVDGDTMDIEFLDDAPKDCKKKERVRLIGVNTPEFNLGKGVPDYFAEEARSFLNRLYMQEVEIELDFYRDVRDRYGRLLAYIWHDGRLVNKSIILGGYGRYYDAFNFNTERMKSFEAAENTARQNRLGIWGGGK